MNFGLIWAPGMAASILSGTPPLFTVVLAALIIGEKMRSRQFVSIALALIGLALLSNDFSVAERSGFLANFCRVPVDTGAPVFMGNVWYCWQTPVEHYHWRLICRDTFSLGALMLLPLAAVEVYLKGTGHWGNIDGFILLYLAIMNSVVTYSLWNSALKEIPVSLASFLIYLQPISGAILSYFLFGEKLATAGLAGTALIFVALTLVLWPEKTVSTAVAENTAEG